MTNLSPAMRERYLADSTATASPAKLLLMLFDRLVMDLVRGEEALVAGDRPEANTHLKHAQDIVTELQVTLNVDAWEGAKDLAALYTFAQTELVNANVRGDAEKVSSIKSLMEPLRDTWREAALAVAAAEG
ncbi:flagellar export chaperone FliS [Couchioplanes caeruleus]|uniref:Flagellar secretion chaperone FliS n=2 Tax=Couchioplanes caeruleus TaxID=56438 RepID=A0A1K0G324_9ACTN|nr:flagellar export chaperone FliS [Couchioplanes caeruleus]OJF11690.1 flagellar export chaperone FliS [Couchioplanes caeruleus subsp. caeruleus]ROP31736.1 flagellar protein FliS [Couchioplanes caeruleus]